MIEIDLCLANGEPVCSVFIPPFVKPPEVVLYQGRSFYRSPLARRDDVRWREVFAVYGSIKVNGTYLVNAMPNRVLG